MILNTCCCCLDLRVGGIVIAILEILGGIGCFIPWVLGSSNLISWDFLAFGIVAGTLGVLSGTSILYGAIKKNAVATLINLILCGLGTIVHIIAIILIFIFSFAENPNDETPVYIIIGVVILVKAIFEIYFWICIYSLYRQLKSIKISLS